MAVQVCVAVVTRDGRVLVRRRPRGTHLAGAWEFPGGRRRPGERGRACAERECREETGLRVAAGREIARVRHDYPDRSVDLRFYSCEVRGGRLRRSSTLRWIAPEALRRMEVPEANRGVIRGLSPSAASPRRGAVPGVDFRTTGTGDSPPGLAPPGRGDSPPGAPAATSPAASPRRRPPRGASGCGRRGP